jgi:hypothetical protein
MDKLKGMIADAGKDGGYAAILGTLHRAGYEVRLVTTEDLSLQFRVRGEGEQGGPRYFSITIKEHL